jgi:ComF family protein
LPTSADGSQLLCQACLAGLLPGPWHGCLRCGTRLDPAMPAANGCLICREARLKFDAVVPLGPYAGPLREAVLQMKRPRHDALSMAVGRLLAEERRDALAGFAADLIVPVPMHWRRRWSRGKNSPELLALCLSKSLRIPVRHRLLVRHRHTEPQSHQTPSGRFRNVAGAFRVRRAKSLENARVLLVDDILTTGATCSAAARVLKKAGASFVAVAVVARASAREV